MLTPLEFGAAATLTNPGPGRDHGALQVGLTPHGYVVTHRGRRREKRGQGG